MSAVAAALVGAKPTGATISDALLTAVVAAIVTAASSRARPWAWTAAAAIAAVAASGAWAAVALAVFVVGVVQLTLVDRLDRPVVGALAGAVIVQVVLHLPTDRTGLNAAVSIAAAALLIASGRAVFASPTGRPTRWALWAVLGFAVLASVTLLVSGWSARHSVEVGVERAQQGLDAARGGDSDRAADLFRQASDAFRSAHHVAAGWWTKPALVVPGVGQQARALDRLTTAGAAVASASADAARAADLQSLRVHDGRLDLQRVSSMSTPLNHVTVALQQASDTASQADSTWLLPAVSHRLESFNHSLDKATTDAKTATDAVGLVPKLLGGRGRRTYFVVFASSSESRDLGGFMGAYGVLTATDGKLELSTTGRDLTLDAAGRGRSLFDLHLPDRYRALQPQRVWGNVTGTSDFPTVASVVAQMWPQSGGRRVDGVVYVDPQTLAALLELTGPVQLQGYDHPLTSANAAEFLQREQYVLFPDDSRHQFLIDAAKDVFHQLTSGDLPPLHTIVDTLSSSVRERRLMVTSLHPAEQDLLRRLNLDGSLPPVDGDFLSVRTSDRGMSKIDAYTHRTVVDDVVVDPSHNSVRAKVTVTVRNDAPSSGLPYEVVGIHRGEPPGTNSTTVTVLTPLQVVDVTQDGNPIGRGAYVEYGRSAYTALLDVLPGTEATVVFELQGTIDLAHGYRLDLVPQPQVNPDQTRIDVTGAGGWSVRGAGTVEDDTGETRHVAVTLQPPAPWAPARSES